MLRSEILEVRSSADVSRVRQLTRQWSAEQGFSLVDQTKIVTAASEIGRNTVIYGGGGVVKIEALQDPGRCGLRLTFEDKGPGIPNVEQALRDGYTTGTGMGLGLGGARRLSNEFHVSSDPGVGTRVVICRWRDI